MVFTEILDNFIKILENVPGNLKSMCMTLLYFFSTIDIALTIYKNIDNPDFNYISWAKTKILKVGFIILAIKSYEWFLTLVKDFFLSIGTKGLGLSLSSNNYFNDPSAIWDKGREIGGLIIDQLSWRPATYIFILLGLLTYIGFFLLAMRIIICWVEYYFLTGFSIIFLPCGALELGVEYYKNVFKTIIGCSIKLGVFNMWLLICDKLMKSIMVAEKKYDLDAALVVCGTVYVLVAIMLSMPSITTGLLTGSPAVNAGAAMTAATGAMGHTYRGAKETLKGAFKGGKTGANLGSSGGAFVGSLGGPVGIAAGKIVGGTLGAIGGATIGGSYAGGRYAVFKEKAKKKDDDGNSNSSSSNNSASNNSNNGNSGNSSGNNSSNGNNSNFNNSGSNNTVTNNQSSSVNNSITPVGGVTSNPQPSVSNSNTSQNNVNSGNNNNSVANNPPDSNSSTTNNSPDSTTKEVSSSNTESSTGISNDVNSNENTSNSNVSNIEKSNTTTTNTTSSMENTTSDVEDNAKKSGIKVNGGEAGKLPDWMQGDY